MFRVTTAESSRPLGGPQATEGWTTVDTKKRKLQAPTLGRLKGAASKAKRIDRDASQSIFNFASQPQQQSRRGASEAPTSKTTQAIENSQMDCDSISTRGEA
jgi:hypothetical protein